MEFAEGNRSLQLYLFEAAFIFVGTEQQESPRLQSLSTLLRLPIPGSEALSLFMPAFVHSQEADALAIKVVSLFPANPSRGLAYIQAAVLVFDPETGQATALLEGSSLTAIRTGAAGGAAIDLLARPESRSVAIFGAGAQGRTQLEAGCTARRIETAFIYDADANKARHFAEEMRGRGTITMDVRVAATGREAVENADILCTATASHRPVFEDIFVRPGTHISAVGSYTADMGVRYEACWSCPMGCCAFHEQQVGAYKTRGLGPEVANQLKFMVECGINELEPLNYLSDLLNEYGLDWLETPPDLGIIFKLYQEGVITKEDTGGVDLSFGDPKSVEHLIHLLAKREEVGNLMAEGLSNIARIIPQAKKYDPTVRGTYGFGDPRKSIGPAAMCFFTPSRGACLQHWDWLELYLSIFRWKFPGKEGLRTSRGSTREEVAHLVRQVARAAQGNGSHLEDRPRLGPQT